MTCDTLIDEVLFVAGVKLDESNTWDNMGKKLQFIMSKLGKDHDLTKQAQQIYFDFEHDIIDKSTAYFRMADVFMRAEDLVYSENN